jgi:hypothetical protein
MIGEKIQKLGGHEKKALAVAGLALLAFVADGVVVRPLLARLHGFDDEIAMVEGEIVLDRSIANQEPIVSREFARVEQLVDVSASPAEIVDRMKAQVDALAGKTGLSITSMEQREPRPGDHYDMYIVEIGSFECQIPQLVQFLYDVGSQPGMLRVSKISFENAPAGDKVRGSMVITKAVVRPT